MIKDYMKKDFIYGKKAEIKIKPILEKHFNINLVHTENYHSFDFFDKENNTYYELKTRRIASRKYKTLIFSHCKVQFIKQHPEYNYYFIYNMSDGLFKFRYEEAKTFLKYSCARSDRGFLEKTWLCHIPSKYLIKIDY